MTAVGYQLKTEKPKPIQPGSLKLQYYDSEILIMKFTIRALIWTFMLISLAAAVYIWMSPNPVKVETTLVAKGTLRVVVREDGISRIREKYVVSSPVSGRLSRIQLQAGDDVTSEKTLIAVILPSAPAILDARTKAEANARVQAAKASLNRAKASTQKAAIDRDLNKKKLDRAEELVQNQGISREAFDIANALFLASDQAVKTGEFEIEIAQFELQMAEAAAQPFLDPKDQAFAEPFEIFAPVSGKVLRLFQESSTVVTTGTPLIEIGDPRELELEIDVLSTDATQIRPGSKLIVEHWGGSIPLQGLVRVVEPAAFTKVSSLGVEEQRVNVIADFKETPERLKTLGDGYRVEAEITVRELQDVTLIPNSALFRFERQWHVMTVKNNRAQLTMVEVGQQNETEAEIIEGLVVGDEVIVYPGDDIDDGTSVTTSNQP